MNKQDLVDALNMALAKEDYERTPSYFERLKPGQEVVLVAVELCQVCGHWHAPEDDHPVIRA